MNINDYILSVLADGPKSWTDLKKEIVDKEICAKGTLSKHLRELEKEKKIQRVVNEDTTTAYNLMPESLEQAKSSKDAITLEQLIIELGYKTRKELQLEDVKSKKKNFLSDLQRSIGPTKKYPNMNFGLQMDEDTLRVVDLVYSKSKLADELFEMIREKLSKIKLKMPSTIKDELKEFINNPMDWNDVTEYSRKVALKHGIRFLVYSWYDGKIYKDEILSANQNLQKWGKGHEEDISFLDEINRRCFFSTFEYYYESLCILEDLIKNFLNISNPYQLLEDAFLVYRENWDLMQLEVALVSETAPNQFSEEVFKKELNRGALEKIKSPYNILSFNEYLKMKLPLLNLNDKKIIIQELLNHFSGFLDAFGKNYSGDYRFHPEDYHQTIDVLIKKLNVAEDQEKTTIELPLFIFLLKYENRKIDF